MEEIKQEFYRFFTISSYIKHFFLLYHKIIKHFENWMLASLIKWLLNFVVSQDRWSFTAGRINMIL